MRMISIMIDVTISDQADPEVVAGAVFDFLADDPDSLFPDITTVDTYDYKILE